MGDQATAKPTQVLQGSSPLPSIFNYLAMTPKALPNRFDRLSDGEPDSHSNFIAWQFRVLTPETTQVAKKHTVDDIKPTGYDKYGIASYATFRALKEAEVVPRDVTRAFVKYDGVCVQIDPLYETRLLKSLHRIQDTIRVAELNIQWNIPFNIAMLEHERGNAEKIRKILKALLLTSEARDPQAPGATPSRGR